MPGLMQVPGVALATDELAAEVSRCSDSGWRSPFIPFDSKLPTLFFATHLNVLLNLDAIIHQ